MQIGALEALEFPRIVEVVQTFAVTPLGAARLAGLRPHTDFRRIQHLHRATSEALRLLAEGQGFPLRAPETLEETLTMLAVEGRALEPIRLLGLADHLESIDECRQLILQRGGQFPLLRASVEPAAAFRSEVAEVRRAIEPSGEVPDHASGELKAVRDRLRRLKTRLRGTLESYLRGKETARYLQEQIITERNGRYVLVIKAEHRAAIPGIVHGSSSSGASLFLEPLSTVEVNNEIVALEQQEAEEVRRVLLALSDLFRRRAADLHRTIEVGIELDAIQARAQFARLVRGVEPVMMPAQRAEEDGESPLVELRGARHPLLCADVVARLQRHQPPTTPPQPIDVVPVDLVVKPPVTALVITGPNTGGKTVALKTMGLLALMAQAGLHIPATSGSRLPVFRSIFADIGDEQSLAASLSTFSAHICNIAAMDRALALPALVLLDEVGAGTDPVEGAALGMALIEHFRRRGAFVLATTHDDTLKTYASTTDGVACAGFGFDPDTFAPTYQLRYGSPGRSLALEIAARLGLNASIIEAARASVSAREARLAEHLAKIDHDLRELDHERRLVARERETLGEAEHRLRAREEALRQREEELRRRFDAKLDAELREARLEIDRIIGDLKRRAAELASEAAAHVAASRGPHGGGASPHAWSTGDAGRVRLEARTALEEVGRRFRERSSALPSSRGAAQAPSADREQGPGTAPGDRVTVLPLAVEGTVLSIHDGEAEIDVAGKRLRSRVSDLRILGRLSASPQISVQVNLQPRDEARSADLNVIGCSVDEALARTEKFLDESLLNERRTVRVIHGHGTGQLRRAIAAFLQDHPLVAHYAAAPPEEGGGGVTVVELKE